MERHGNDAKVLVLPYARYQLPRNIVRMDAEPLRFPQEVLCALTPFSVRGVGAARGADAAAPPPDEIRGSTTIVELLRMFPGGEARSLLAALALPCAHCGGASTSR